MNSNARYGWQGHAKTFTLLSTTWAIGVFLFTLVDASSWELKQANPLMFALRVECILMVSSSLLVFLIIWKSRTEAFLISEWSYSLSGTILLLTAAYLSLLETSFVISKEVVAIKLLTTVLGVVALSWSLSSAMIKTASIVRYLRPPPSIQPLWFVLGWIAFLFSLALFSEAAEWDWSLNTEVVVPEVLADLAYTLTLVVPTSNSVRLLSRFRGPSRWMVSSLVAGLLAGLSASTLALLSDLLVIPESLSKLGIYGSIALSGLSVLPSMLYYLGGTTLLAPREGVRLASPLEGFVLVEAPPGVRYVTAVYDLLESGMIYHHSPLILLTHRGSSVDSFKPLKEKAELVVYLSATPEPLILWEAGGNVTKVPPRPDILQEGLSRLLGVGGTVVLLDNLTDVVTVIGFEETILLISEVKEVLNAKDSSLVAIVFPEANTEQEIKRVEMLADTVIDLRSPEAPIKRVGLHAHKAEIGIP